MFKKHYFNWNGWRIHVYYIQGRYESKITHEVQYYSTVSQYCILILYPSTVSQYCILVLYSSTESQYCILVLYPGTLSQYCILVLYPAMAKDFDNKQYIVVLARNVMSKTLRTSTWLPMKTYIVMNNDHTMGCSKNISTSTGMGGASTSTIFKVATNHESRTKYSTVVLYPSTVS